jgi:hypothetical protein
MSKASAKRAKSSATAAAQGAQPAVAPRSVPRWLAAAVFGAAILIFYWVPITSSVASIQWDAADMHYPLQKYFADRLFSGQLPFWTPYWFAGYPLLANPEMASWYPPHWPFFLAGITPLSIQLELALNALLACWGAWFLLSKLVSNRWAAVVGAFSYGLSGFFAGHSSHVGLFCAAAWFPWLLAAYRRAMESNALRYAALGGLAGGCMILAGYVQTAMYAFLALALYAAAETWEHRTHVPRQWLRSGCVVGGMLTASMALAAIQILPGLELTSYSSRAAANYASEKAGVLQLKPLMTLVWPNALGAISGDYTGPFDITQYYFYAGVLLLPLAALGAWKKRSWRLPLCLILLPIWYMLGPDAGLYRLGALIPGLHSVRAPVQGWFVAGLGLALLAATGCDWILTRWRAPYLGIALAVFVFADLCYWNSLQNPMAYARGSFEELYGAHEAVARDHIAADQPPLTRFEAPQRATFLGPTFHPLDLKLEATYGYFALEPAAYDDYVSAMAVNPKLRDGLNVSRVLNTTTGRIDRNLSVLPRAYFPHQVRDLGTTQQTRDALATLDPANQAIALAPHAPVQQDPNATAAITGHDEQSYRIHYRAASPSLLKLSVPWFPGWRAMNRGAELPVMRVDHYLMGVVLPAGEGDVEVRFRSNYFVYGAVLSLLAAVVLAVLAWRAGPLRYDGKNGPYDLPRNP